MIRSPPVWVFWANSVPDGGGKNGEYTVDHTSKIGLVGKEQG